MSKLPVGKGAPSLQAPQHGQSAPKACFEAGILRFRRSAVPVSFVFAFLFVSIVLTNWPARGDEFASLKVEPGVPVRREFGDMALRILVDRQKAALNLSILLGGRVVGEKALTPYDNVYPLKLQAGPNVVEGGLFAYFGYAGEVSSLEGDFTVTQCRAASGGCKTESLPYRQEIADWSWSSPPILQHWTVWLTPELNAEIDLQYTKGQTVLAAFETVGQIIRTTSLTQGANRSQFTEGAAVGTVTIEPNMLLTMRPATPAQMGGVSLDGVFSSSDHQHVKYAGTIAAWPYVAPQTSGGRAP